MGSFIDRIKNSQKEKKMKKLIATLQGDDIDAVVSAIETLQEIGDILAIDSIVKMLSREAKSEIINDEALGPIVKAALEENPDTDLDLFIKKMNWDEGYRKIRIAAAKALGALGDRKALESLIKVGLADIDEEVRFEATSAIVKIKGIDPEKYGGVKNIPLADLLAG